MMSGIVTAILLVLFLIGSVWAFSPRRKPEFDAAARLALDDAAPADEASQQVEANATSAEETPR
jgi:cytochrome c oxidase cbb3-type subunit IV